MSKINSFEPDITEQNYIDVMGDEFVEPDFIDDIERAMFTEARMGEEVIRFLNSDPGRMIRSLVKQDIRDNTALLKRTHPWRKRRIQALQNKINNGETLLFYLADLIQRGEHAYIQLMSNREGIQQ